MTDNNNIEEKHISVLLDELVDSINIFSDRKNVIVDGTLGMWGHASKIIEKMNPKDTFIWFDADIQNLSVAKQRLSQIRQDIELIFIHSNFWYLREELEKRNINSITGIYYDLGLSSLHLDEADRGFSFMLEGPLDMRLDKSTGITAADIVNSYQASELREIFMKYWEEPGANKFSAQIVAERKQRKFKTTSDLASMLPSSPKTRARVFQALRIEVNKELEHIETSFKHAIELLEKDGIIFVISFHSLEDRITKQIFKKETKDCICSDIICSCHHTKQLQLLQKKPILPTQEEITSNPRSRSAKARSAQKII